MYRPEPPVFNQHTIKCEKDGCPLIAEYEAITTARKKHFRCEQHWKELVNIVQMVSWKKI